MKTAHEAPLSIFDMVSDLTDYDYALVHLFEENPGYLAKFEEKRDQGREIILDNSIFELGESFDSERFAHWVRHLKPTWYIIPDALEKKDDTIAKLDDFQSRFPDLPGQSIGVAQGKSYDEMVECYQYVAPRVDKVAISFDYSFFVDWFPNEKTKYHAYMKGRQRLIQQMIDDGVIRFDQPHHLLGCGLPQEFKAYKDYHWIDSMDSSNPVVHGLLGIPYTEEGLEDKSSIKLFTLVDDEVDNIDLIRYNINKFREFVS